MLGTDVSSTMSSMFDLQQQISSGKKINKPSDDPGAYETINRLHDDLSNIQQYTTNANSLTRDLTLADNSLRGVSDMFQRASEIAVKGGDATLSAQDRASLGAEIDSILKQVIDVANTSESGHYIFSGLRSNTKPYAGVDFNGDGNFDAVVYNGSTQTRQVEIGNGSYVPGNLVGSDPAGSSAVFETSTTNLFQTLITLRDNLLSNTNTSTTTDLDQVTKGLDHIITMTSMVGARQEQVKTTSDLLTQQETNIQNSLGTIESVDMAKAATELSQRQLAYQAALRSASMTINQKTLVDMI